MEEVLITTPTFAKYSDRAVKILQDAGLKVVRVKQPINDDNEIINYLGNTVAIIAGLEPITEKVINSAKNLKVIAKHGIGVDNIDLNAARQRNVVVANAPGTNCEAVADLVFGLALSLARKIPEANNIVRSGQWPKMIGHSVWEKTIGIIGLGAIGRSVVRRAHGFNMTILGYDICYDQNFIRSENVKIVSIDELLRESDFITIHVPLNDSTRNLISLAQLKMMKPTAYLINTSRGGIVNEQELYEALKNGYIAGAALDVFEKEPPIGCPLLTLPNVIATPHMGGYTDQALNLTSEYTAKVVLDVLNGHKPESAIT